METASRDGAIQIQTACTVLIRPVVDVSVYMMLFFSTFLSEDAVLHYLMESMT